MSSSAVAAEAQEVLLGTFWFASGDAYLAEVDALVKDDARVNGEHYVNSIAARMVDRGKRVLAFCVDKFIPWGTPEELMAFRYWKEVQSGGRPFMASSWQEELARPGPRKSPERSRRAF